MTVPERVGMTQSLIIVGVIGLVLFVVGFWLARATAEKAAAAENSTKVERSRYQFLQVGDTVAAIDVVTGEAYAIDGNTRAWTVLAPALPAKEAKTAK